MAEEKKQERMHKFLRRGYGWKLSTAVLFALLIISIFSSGFKDFFGALSSKDASEQAVNYINTNLLSDGEKAVLGDVLSEGDIYSVNLKVGDVDFKSYVTKDGKYLFPQGIDMTEKTEEVTPTTATGTGAATTSCEGIAKGSKPVIELFVMSHCPYGTQIEKGIIPALKLLKGKVDFKLRFVYYAMHGEKEVKEELNQYCIQKEQNDKLLSYLECFLKEGSSESCLTETKIDAGKLKSCTEAADKEFKILENLNDNSKWLNGRFPLFNVDKAANEKYGVGGSPTLVINAGDASSGRDPASLLGAICCAFSEQPAECKQTLSSAAPSPGFGTTTTTNSGGSCG